MTLQSNNSLVKEIIFIDPTVEDYQSLLAGIYPDTKVVILDQMKDGISQITENLQGGTYKTVHIVSHGGEGSLQLGSKQLNSSNLDSYKSQLQQWAKYLTDEADILLYGCDVAAGETGVGFVQQLSQLTGADVAASNDLTGNAALGGDWDLEVKTGKIESNVAFTPEVRNSYRSILPSIYINEILFDPPSTDSPNEYIELRGTPNTTIPSGTYLVGIEGDSESNPGDIQNIFDLSGKTFGSNGFLVLLQKGNSYSVNPNANVLTNSGTGNGWGNGTASSIGHSGDTGTTTEIENASASFLLIQTGGFAPSLSDDIDSNDDGTPDGSVYSGWTVLDSVAVLDGSSATTDRAYGSIVFKKGTNGTAQSGATVVNTSFAAGYVGRISDTTGSASTDWVASSVSGSGSSFALGLGANTSSASLANRSLIHIGSTNFPTNTAPTLNNTGNPILNIIAEDIADTSNGGTLVPAILASGAGGNSISDVDADARKGIAVTYVDKSNGTWEYSLNNGTNWSDFVTPALNAARLLPSDVNTKIRFRPNTNFSGTADINFYAWDQTTGTSGSTANILITSTRGGSTAFSTAYEGASITVNPVNDTAPTLGAGIPTLTAINEDESLTSNKGTSVANLIKGLITDTDKDPQGIAVTGVDNSNGSWQYTLDGGANWTNLGVLSDSSATLLSAGVVLYDGSLSNLPSQQGWLQFGNVPSPLPGAGSQTIISGGGTQLLSTTAGSTGYSNYNSYTPVLLNQSFPVLDRTKGFTVSFDLKINSESHTDTNRAGFSVTVVTSDKTKAIELGLWENEIWAQTATPLFNHSTTEFKAFDTKTSVKHYDLKIKDDTYQLFVTGEIDPILSGSLRDYTAFEHTTGAPIIGSLPFDPYETPNFLYFGDNTTSAQADVNLARVELQTNTKVRFQANADYNGTANINFRAWDASDGKASSATGVDASVNGGTTAYSSGNKTATLTINSVNDRPTFTIGANQSVKTGAAQQTIAGWASGFYAGAANESGQKVAEYIVEVISNSGVVQDKPTINLAGDLIYTPSAIGTAEFRVKVRDDGGTANGGFDTSISTTQTLQTFKINVNSTTTNSIYGTPNPDTLMGTDQSDRISGLDNDDIIYGGLGSDRIFGDNGNDTLYGDLGIKSDNSDIKPVYGATFSMDDTIAGGAGNDKIYGNLGNDKLYGDEGNDQIWGGEGNDEIWGSYGNDTLYGGSGKDAFVLVKGQGADTIMDFTTEDVLGCAGALRYSSLSFKTQNGDTLITDTGTNQLLATLKGFTGTVSNGGLF